MSEPVITRPLSPPLSAEHALMSMAVALAPDEGWAFSLVSLVSDSLNSPEQVRADYPRWLDVPSWSNHELAREALLTALTGNLWALEPLVAGFDWRASAQQIHRGLRQLFLSPLATWEPDPRDDYAEPDPDAAAPYLRKAARRSRAAGMALFSIDIGDSFTLGFVRSDRADLLVSDAARAGYTRATDQIFRLVDG
ncbi:DUF6630 family protein [Nocardia yamanashiensis]|uniref:DUF6630 family protein n=1 Tax=Nocardia yamanashiensis TaxID=209247 RepID=UPI000A6053E0|nr:hypothetical protein [Nocardia yamanashiensis]